MTTLRTRLIALLVSAILLVVVLAAGVTFLVIERPDDGALSGSEAEKVVVVSRLLGGSVERARKAGFTVVRPPASATVDAERTREIAEALRALGSSLPVLVVETGERTRRIAFPVANDAWVEMRLPSHPPSPIRPLVAYVSLVVAGAAAIAVAVAARVLRPVRLMETIISSVRADGGLDPIAETGTPEERAIARSFNALSARLAAAFEGRMRFIAAAGHDIRTPLTRLRLRAEFLPDGDRAVWLRDLAEIDAIADSAIRLVREETDPASFEPVPLGELIGTIVAELHELGLPVSVSASQECVVRAQPLALKRALRNLIENAVRHGGAAHVAWEATGDTARVVIEDDGPGIPAHLMDRVFEPFFSVDPARQKTTGGAGLGLAIAREIVERQGGCIRLRNRASGGLRQEVGLPVASV
ncbi:two-component sensor histidine kinase [Aureimonas flava]|uniref:histidine kinase n=1 Tax=Aureimonas flava TaxID=2320271 RepID=A0A3A1WT10_9HYPH|nr:ATP-binding protein [Aureimonas flava]RIY01384.1 two-component sensor histidine kinase [Aureimonas flava]